MGACCSRRSRNKSSSSTPILSRSQKARNPGLSSDEKAAVRRLWHDFLLDDPNHFSTRVLIRICTLKPEMRMLLGSSLSSASGEEAELLWLAETQRFRRLGRALTMFLSRLVHECDLSYVKMARITLQLGARHADYLPDSTGVGMWEVFAQSLCEEMEILLPESPVRVMLAYAWLKFCRLITTLMLEGYLSNTNHTRHVFR